MEPRLAVAEITAEVSRLAKKIEAILTKAVSIDETVAAVEATADVTTSLRTHQHKADRVVREDSKMRVKMTLHLFSTTIT